MKKIPGLTPRVLAALAGTDYEIVPGKKHWLLMINGKQVTALSRGSHAKGKDDDMTVASIRRHLRRGGTRGEAASVVRLG